MAVKTFAQLAQYLIDYFVAATRIDSDKLVEYLQDLNDTVSFNVDEFTESFLGLATTSTDPGTPTVKVFYLAEGPGTYTNFLDDGENPIVITEEFAFLIFNGTYWEAIETNIDLALYAKKTADAAMNMNGNRLYGHVPTLTNATEAPTMDVITKRTKTWYTNITDTFTSPATAAMDAIKSVRVYMATDAQKVLWLKKFRVNSARTTLYVSIYDSAGVVIENSRSVALTGSGLMVAYLTFNNVSYNNITMEFFFDNTLVSTTDAEFGAGEYLKINGHSYVDFSTSFFIYDTTAKRVKIKDLSIIEGVIAAAAVSISKLKKETMDLASDKYWQIYNWADLPDAAELKMIKAIKHLELINFPLYDSNGYPYLYRVRGITYRTSGSPYYGIKTARGVWNGASYDWANYKDFEVTTGAITLYNNIGTMEIAKNDHWIKAVIDYSVLTLNDYNYITTFVYVCSRHSHVSDTDQKVIRDRELLKGRNVSDYITGTILNPFNTELVNLKRYFPQGLSSGKQGILTVRFNSPTQQCAELFAKYGASFSYTAGDILGVTDKDSLDTYKLMQRLGHDVCPVAVYNGDNSVIKVSSAADKALITALEGVLGSFIWAWFTYSGTEYGLIELYVPDPAGLPASKKQAATYTVSAPQVGGNNLTLSYSSWSNTAFIIADTEENRAVFPAGAIGELMQLTQVSGTTFACKVHGKFNMLDYYGEGLKAATAAPVSITLLYRDTYYPDAIGFEVMLWKIIRDYRALGLERPYATGEQETEGWPKEDFHLDIMKKLGFLGACKGGGNNYPSSYHRPYAQFKLDPTTAPTEISGGDMAAVKLWIATKMARHQVRGFTTSSCSGWGYSNWETLLAWCREKGIPVLSYSKAGQILGEMTPNPSVNVAPQFWVDLDDDDVPDGYETLPAGVTFQNSGGLNAQQDCQFTFAHNTADKLTSNNITGLEPGRNRVMIAAANNGDGTDVIEVKIFNSVGPTDTFLMDFNVNGATTAYVTNYFDNDSWWKNMEIRVKTWASSGDLILRDLVIRAD
jgi:hypothetical protein